MKKGVKKLCILCILAKRMALNYGKPDESR